MNLNNTNISYLIFSSNDKNIFAILDSKEYKILPLLKYCNGIYNESIIGYSDVDNDTLRKDAIFLLERINYDFAIIKYKGDVNPKKIYTNGSEKLLNINTYTENNNDDITFVYKGLSFSFTEKNRYWIPNSKEDIKIGMIIEYFNNNKWNEKIVIDPNLEWNKLYKLLSKYNKIRVKSNK